MQHANLPSAFCILQSPSIPCRNGFANLPDPSDHTIVFTESQGGNLGRIDVTTGARTGLRPVARPTVDDEDRSFRFNWNTPIVISSHNSATVYVGANVLLKTTDRGATWREISPDLTKQIDRAEQPIMGVLEADGMMSRHDGISSYGNITSIAESPINPDVLYVGTDDGNVQVTRDAGATWQNVTDRVRGMAERTYVSRLVASRFDEALVYATFDGHRNDDYAPFVYVSDDYGRNWDAIDEGLPAWSVNVIVEHHRNPNLLFLGNEIGLYFSVNRGEHWTRLKNNLPTVPVDDIVVHPRENDLILGTHGRSIWIMPDITPLEQLSDELLATSGRLFPIKPATMYYRMGGWPFNAGKFTAPNPPQGAVIRYYLGANLVEQAAVTAETETGGPSAGSSSRADRGGAEANIVIVDAGGETIRELEGPGDAGIQQVAWDLRFQAPPAPDGGGGPGGGGRFGGASQAPLVLPGTYTVRLDVAGRIHTTELVVKSDPRVKMSEADVRARHEAVMSLFELSKSVTEARQATRRLSGQVAAVKGLLAEHPDPPEPLAAAIDSLGEDLDDLDDDIGTASRDTRLQGAIERSDALPTADQLWQMNRAWERVSALIETLNDIITVRMPAINRQLDAEGIRPDPGREIAVPARSGRR